MSIPIEDIISKNVSYQTNAWSEVKGEITIGEIIKEIKRGTYKQEVEQLRTFLKNGDKERYDSNKKRLPGVTFCAAFDDKRRKECLKEYHNLIVIDIDKLSGAELKQVKNSLSDDKFVFTFWLSPSMKGYKGLVYLQYKFDIDRVGVDESHKIAFEQLTQFFKEEHSIELDISGSDTTRLCFLSYDKDLIFKSEINPFIVEDISLKKSDTKDICGEEKISHKKRKVNYVSSKDILNNPKGKNNQRHRKTILQIIKFLTKNKSSITSTYDDWYRVAYAIANSFTYDIGEKYFLSLCELDGVKHDEVESKNILLYCYQNSHGTIGFSSIVFMAKNKGFKI